jgi:PAS domain S-box-containing protein
VKAAAAELTKDELRKVTHELGERIKELRCLCDISALALKQESLPELLSEVVAVIPPAWQYPEVACARVVLDGEEYRSDNHGNPPWHIASDIRVGGEAVGAVEVGYLELRPNEAEGPFLAEERALLDAIAERLGSIVGRQRAEESLRLSDRTLRRSQLVARAVMDSTPHVVAVLDREARLLDANEATVRGLGVPIDKLRGASFWDVCAPHLMEGRRAAFDQVLRTGESVRHEDTNNDGTRTVETTLSPIVDAEQIVGVVALSYDITERKKAEEALRESERRLQSIFRVAPTGIGTVRDRILLEVNQRICEMTGYAERELIGQSAQLLYPTQEDYDYVGREKYRQIAEEGTGEVETRWRRRDGAVIDVLLASTPINPLDLSQGVTFTALDITERKRAEEQRLSLERQVQQTQKLESLGVLAGGIAHDFNNVLTGLLVNAELSLDVLPAHSPIRPMLLDVHRAGKRAADLTAQMLAYSGHCKFEVMDIDINALVRDMASLLESATSKKAELRYELCADLPAVTADATQLRQIVLNLVTNASEAVGEQEGQVAVRTYTTDSDAAFFDAASPGAEVAEGRYVTIEVTDTGCGMDESTKAKIFDPFFTTKFTGRGLGLSALQGIVRAHNGAILVESELGKGTTFKVLLPALDHPAVPVGERSKEEAGWHGVGTVLVVDDEEMVRNAAVRILRRSGVAVLTASDGVEAVELFRERHDEIACVLLDLKMPRMDGEETFDELRKINRDVPVILLSGYSEQQSTERFAGKGLAGFIQKPYNAEDLRDKVREVLGNGE